MVEHCNVLLNADIILRCKALKICLLPIPTYVAKLQHICCVTVM